MTKEERDKTSLIRIQEDNQLRTEKQTNNKQTKKQVNKITNNTEQNTDNSA
jgi:hypothetical protein